MSESRIDKLLSSSGLASRTEAKMLIRQGRVSANGIIVTSPESKFDGEKDDIRLDGQRINCNQFRYFMMNKPSGILSATEDRSQQTVIDFLPLQLQKLNLFPVGRLDKDTTGLLLLTNDGVFAHQVISPKYHISKIYLAELEFDLSIDAESQFENGVVLSDGTKCLPAKLETINSKLARVTVFEGKYHQVKRMFAAVGNHVVHLHREQIGALKLDSDLSDGMCRELTRQDLILVMQ